MGQGLLAKQVKFHGEIVCLKESVIPIIMRVLPQYLRPGVQFRASAPMARTAIAVARVNFMVLDVDCFDGGEIGSNDVKGSMVVDVYIER